MLFNSINLLFTFFSELYSNIFLNIITPLVVKVQKKCGKHSDNEGLNPIPPYGHLFSQSQITISIKARPNKAWRNSSVSISATAIPHTIYLRNQISLNSFIQPLILGVIILPNVLVICDTSFTKGINHLGDKI